MYGPTHRHAFVKPPRAARRPQVSSWHGIELVDDYAWLKADNWQEVMRDPAVLDAEIRAYLEAENAHTEAQLAETRTLQEDLFLEMRGRLKEDDSSVPAPDGPYAYYTGYVAGGQYPLVYRCGRHGGDEVVLLDGNREAEGKPYWDLGGFQHSPDHRLLAYASDDKGSELYTIRLRDTATGQDLADTIPDTRGNVVWANDSKTLFYVRLDEHHRPLLVYRHIVGTPAENDVLVYAENDIGLYVAISATQSSKFVTIDAHDHRTSEVRLIDADAPLAEPVLVEPRCIGHEYSVEHHGDKLIITTNSEGAEDFRIVETPVSAPGMQNWREIIPHRPGCLVLDTVLFRNHMVRLERENGLPRIIVRRIADGAEHVIAFPEEAYSLGISPGYEFDTTTLRFVYSSMTTPAETYDYDMETRARVLRKRQQVPSGHNPADYVTRRLYAPARDGETVPVSILYHKSTPLDGSAPVLLYGYGAYGISIPA
ncbi:MAG: S9 family peptidase, partial [Hyphomicrobium sp.]